MDKIRNFLRLNPHFFYLTDGCFDKVKKSEIYDAKRVQTPPAASMIPNKIIAGLAFLEITSAVNRISTPNLPTIVAQKKDESSFCAAMM